MERLPPDVAASVVRGLGRYLHSAPASELPKELRRYRGFRPATLIRHRDRLLEAIEDEALRTEILEWLDETRGKLNKSDAANLRLALERPRGWADQLAARSRARDQPEARADPSADLEGRIAGERARAKLARDELKSARREARTALNQAEERAKDLRATIERLSSELKAARAAVAEAERDVRAARSELERERRKARREVEKATVARVRSGEEAKAARKAASAATRQVSRLQARVEALEAAAQSRSQQRAPAAEPTVRRGRRRRPLTVPKGRPGDDAQTLDEWLARPRVRLLVDGYNVTKAEGGFGDLKLEDQRERLIQELKVLALRRDAPVTVVFDGSDMPPGMARRMRGPVAVEYSRPGETADDHLIALLEELPPNPVVVATNDRELRTRAGALGATIASSDQLLGLIR